jgi:2-amino-4-hydroxy-6-hydroxymethyldihydropteridine diphosphokinase
MRARMFSQRETPGENAILLQRGKEFVSEWTVTGSGPVGILGIQRMGKVDDACLACCDTLHESRLLGGWLLGRLRRLARCNEKQSCKSHDLFHNLLVVVYLALGSNLGNREQFLRSALDGLSKREVQIIRSASIYSTEPLEVRDQPWFLNTVIEGSTSLGPEALLQTCLAVEEENQRKRGRAKGPRTLDIDIIFYGDEIVQRPDLSIPHPQFSERRFVLEPLAEIASEFVDPMSGKTVRQLLAATSDSAEVRRIAPPLLQ